MCRQLIRHAGNTIRHIHRHEFHEAQELLNKASQLLAEIKSTIYPHGELNNQGFVIDAEKEFAEASITLALITGNRLPHPDELSIHYAAYLNGLGEAIGELRRYFLDSVRGGDLSHGEEILDKMDDVYSLLVTIDFPDSITRGLRRTTDMVRGVLERTRSDLTLTMRQKDLSEKLNNFSRSPPHNNNQ
jgi:translin